MRLELPTSGSSAVSRRTAERSMGSPTGSQRAASCWPSRSSSEPSAPRAGHRGARFFDSSRSRRPPSASTELSQRLGSGPSTGPHRRPRPSDCPTGRAPVAAVALAVPTDRAESRGSRCRRPPAPSAASRRPPGSDGQADPDRGQAPLVDPVPDRLRGQPQYISDLGDGEQLRLAHGLPADDRSRWS